MKLRFVFIFILFFILGSVSFSFAEGEKIFKTSIKKQRFVPDEIHIKGERSILLQVTNEDSMPVEFESTDLNKEKVVHPGKTIEILLKGLEPGVYEFFSDFGPKDLRGKIIVE